MSHNCMCIYIYIWNNPTETEATRVFSKTPPAKTKFSTSVVQSKPTDTHRSGVVENLENPWESTIQSDDPRIQWNWKSHHFFGWSIVPLQNWMIILSVPIDHRLFSISLRLRPKGTGVFDWPWKLLGNLVFGLGRESRNPKTNQGGVQIVQKNPPIWKKAGG